MIEDEAYLRRLREVFAANDPSDGIDRQDGFGRDVWVESLRPADDGPYEELEVTYRMAVPDRTEFRDVPRRSSTRLPFGRDWREASGHADPAELARTIAVAVFSAATGVVQQMRGDERRRAVNGNAVRARLPDKQALWRELLERLEEYGAVRELVPGRVELLEERDYGEPAIVTLVVTPDQWRDFVVSAEIACRLDSGTDARGRGQGRSEALFQLEEAIDSRHPDDRFIVFDRTRFGASVRAELPLVSGAGRAVRLLRQR